MPANPYSVYNRPGIQSYAQQAYGGWQGQRQQPQQSLPQPGSLTGTQQPANTGIGQAVQDVDIARIINEQLAQTQTAQQNTVAARQQGADVLGGAINNQSMMIQNLLAKLQGNAGMINQGFNDARDQILPRLNLTEGETTLQDSLFNSLNTDVFSREMIDKLETLGRERAGAAYQGAKSNANIDFARRGLSGTGLEKETEFGFMQDALNSIMQNSVQAELSGADINAQNKAQTQGLLNEFNTSTGGRINSLLALLGDNANNQAGANLDLGQLGLGAVTSMNPLIGQMADIYSGTTYEPPDLSGFLGLGMQNRELQESSRLRDMLLQLQMSEMGSGIDAQNRQLASRRGGYATRDRVANPYQEFLNKYFGSN